MSFWGEAAGAAIGTVIFWAGFCGLTLTVCGAMNLSKHLRRKRRRLELKKHLHGWEWPPL